MNDTLKKRLVGAVVLVSLAVILIPLLLKGPSDHSSMPMFGSNVPEKPDYQFETIDIPLQVPPDQGQGAPADQVRAVETPEEAAVEDTPAPATTASAPQAGSASAPEKPANTGAAAPAGPEAWVVQVGSFGSAKNAFALRDSLRGKGFNAFVEKVEADGKTVYRVRIGPQLTREAAEGVRTKLATQTRFKGLVMHH